VGFCSNASFVEKAAGTQVGSLHAQTSNQAARTAGERAAQQIATIRASILALNNDDLLDRADIFNTEPRGWLGEVAFVEMTRRGISL
jgi:hypothetical protein